MSSNPQHAFFNHRLSSPCKSYACHVNKLTLLETSWCIVMISLSKTTQGLSQLLTVFCASPDQSFAAAVQAKIDTLFNFATLELPSPGKLSTESYNLDKHCGTTITLIYWRDDVHCDGLRVINHGTVTWFYGTSVSWSLLLKSLFHQVVKKEEVAPQTVILSVLLKMCGRIAQVCSYQVGNFLKNHYQFWNPAVEAWLPSRQFDYKEGSCTNDAVCCVRHVNLENPQEYLQLLLLTSSSAFNSLQTYSLLFIVTVMFYQACVSSSVLFTLQHFLVSIDAVFPEFFCWDFAGMLIFLEVKMSIGFNLLF